MIDPNSTSHVLSIEDAIDAAVDTTLREIEIWGQPTGALVSDIPLSARISGERSDRLASSSSWLNRYRRASGGCF